MTRLASRPAAPSPYGGPLWAGRRVGLLGGSFNPAHEGHRHISAEALKQLRLDYVWWLVSPQNPLKPRAGMAPLQQRLATARGMADHPRIVATDLETRLRTLYTIDTLQALRRRFPATKFVWLMGADNLAQIDRWQRWPQIFEAVPVAIFDRPSYFLRALSGKAARRFARYRLKESQASLLADTRPPAWVFFHNRLNAASATALRARRAGHPDAALAITNRGKGHSSENL